jgi:hypothetical protein
MKHFQANDQKFRELILYISQQCANQPTFGATKLNKILYFSDFLAYADNESPITGHEYQKLKAGPAPRKLPAIREQMIREGILAIQPIELNSGYVQERPVNLRKPELKMFTGNEIAIVDRVIAALENSTAKAASDLSHKMVGWLAAKDGETIPYCSILISNEPLSEAEIRRGRELAARFPAWA